MPTEYTDEEIISAGPYGCVYVLASDYAALEAERERCINCGDRLDVQDGHCENCLARALQWGELVRAHNAELARVKAESLRVVPDGEAVELVTLYGHQKFLFDDYGVCEMKNPGRYDSTVDVRVLATGEVMNCEMYAVFVKPVRLERWEDEG